MVKPQVFFLVWFSRYEVSWVCHCSSPFMHASFCKLAALVALTSPLSSSLHSSLPPLHSPVFSPPSSFPLSVPIYPLSTQQGSGGVMECTGSSCYPPNQPTAKYPALPLFSQPSHCVALLVMLAPCISLHFSLLFVTPIRPPSPKQSIHARIILARAALVALTSLFATFLTALSTLLDPSSLPRFPPPLLPSSLSRYARVWSQQVAHTGVAVAGDMDGSLLCSHLPFHFTAPSTPLTFLPLAAYSLLFSSLLSVEGRGVGVNTAAPSRPSSVAVQVAVVGGEGGSTSLGWDGKGEYRAGMGRESIGLGWEERLSGWDGKRDSPSGDEFPALLAAPLGGGRRFSGGSTTATITHSRTR
ncbi:unnamed protein product [Closterium sp. NIES-65]|nr:unnamed protein product [Closterium sp. NIES-65]